jgi:hypothetical protein
MIQAEATSPATTKRQRDIMRHALLGGSGKYRKPFRNYFCANVGGEFDADIEYLVSVGLMTKGPLINDGRDYYAQVTEAGKAEVLP